MKRVFGVLAIAVLAILSSIGCGGRSVTGADSVESFSPAADSGNVTESKVNPNVSCELFVRAERGGLYLASGDWTAPQPTTGYLRRSVPGNPDLGRKIAVNNPFRFVNTTITTDTKIWILTLYVAGPSGKVICTSEVKSPALQ